MLNEVDEVGILLFLLTFVSSFIIIFELIYW